jgi:hypothetical protein
MPNEGKHNPTGALRIWSGRWESNPRPKLGKLLYCHCTTPARFYWLNDYTATPPPRPMDLPSRRRPPTTSSAYSGIRQPGQAEQRSHSCRICSHGIRPFPSPALVWLGAAWLDADARPSRPAYSARRFADLRHRHRVGSLAALPAHRGGKLAGDSRRHRARSRPFSNTHSRRHYLSRPAGVVCGWRRGPCLRDNSGGLPPPLSSPWHRAFLVTC